MAKFTTSTVLRLLKREYFPHLDKNTQVEIHQFNEGYMNTCLKLQITNDRKQTQKFIAIIYNINRYSSTESQRHLESAYKAAQILAQNEIPARTPILNTKKRPLTKIRLYTTGPEHIFGLYNYLPGKTLPWEGWTRRHLRALGMGMARIHRTWESVNPEDFSLPKWNSYLNKDSQRLLTYFCKNQTTITQKLGLEFKFGAIESLIKSIDIEEGYQIVHYDLVRGNVLFSKRKQELVYPITGIIDFEKTMIAPTSIDLARTLSFLLVDCKYKKDFEIQRYFLHEGYIASGQAKPTTVEALRTFMIYFWLRDLWKFLSSNPYEDLKKNYHYNATVKRLTSHHILNETTRNPQGATH